jgi:hypothetical protein
MMCLELRELTRRLLSEGWHCGGQDTVEDKLVLQTIRQRDADPEARNKAVLRWLRYYKVLMFFPPERSRAIADEILRFADEPREMSLHGDKRKILSEFSRLKARISTVAPVTKTTGQPKQLLSLTSKALWCCYPEDVPIFDKNASCALSVISRLCRTAPKMDESDYASFVDVWLRVYSEVESIISEADLSDCTHKVRALDRLLWYLGQPGFYKATNSGGASSARA